MSLMSLTAVELGKKIKAKEVTVTEAVTAALDAIEAKEKKVNSFVTVDREGALKRAEEVQKMIDDGTLEADGKISEDEFVKALFVNNVTIFVNGSETGFYIDLDAEPDYFMGHLVCIEVDCKYKIEVGGFNG